MEFFAELFEEKPIEQLKKSLKSLQTILGDFNDYSVQKTFLVEQLQKHDNINSNTQAAIDCLLCALDEKQRNERTKIYSAFAKFGSANTAKKFIDLFAT
jgi:CHAD domain.